MTTKDLLILKAIADQRYPLSLFQLITDNGDIVYVHQIKWSPLYMTMLEASKHMRASLFDTITKSIKEDQGDSWFYDIIGEYKMPKDILVVHIENFFK